MHAISPSAPHRPPPTLTERRLWWGFLVGVLLLGALVYFPARHFGFSNFDDPLFLTGNPWLHYGLHWPGVRWALLANLTEHSRHAEYWSPLTLLSRLTEAQCFGMNPGAFHIVSVLLHGLNAVLLALALRQLTGYTGRSALVALLFLVQAQNVEPVCWLSARKDVLNATFYLATLLAYGWYVRRQTRARYGLVLLAYLACLMAKPMGVSLPFVLLVLDFWPLRRWPAGNRRESLRLLAEKLPFLLLAGLAAGLAVQSQVDWTALAGTAKLSMPLRVGNALLSYTIYLRRIFWPDDLCAFYPHPSTALPLGRTVWAGVVLVALTVGAWLGRRRAPMLLAGWLWFGLMLGPVIGLVQIGSQAMADRYAYLAAVGPIMALVWWLGEHWPKRWQQGAGALALVVSTCFSTQHVLYWKDDVTLFSRALAVGERNWMAHLNLGCALFTLDRPAEAQVHLRRAVEISPTVAASWTDLAQVEVVLGHDREAIHDLAIALRLDGHNTHNMLLIGLLEKKLGDLPKAEAALLQMQRTAPEAPEAPLELGNLYAERDDWARAGAAWGEYLRLQPGDAETARRREEALAKAGR